MAPTGRSSAQYAATFDCSSGAARYWRIARRVAAGQDQPVVGSRVDVAPRDRPPELRGFGQLPVERDRLGIGAELAEDHAGQQSFVAGGLVSLLGREDHLVSAVGQQPPRHGDLGRVEVAVGEGDQDADSAILCAEAVSSRRGRAAVLPGS